MFKFVLVAFLLGLCVAENVDQPVEIRSYQNDPADAEGNYAYAFDTTNGISIQESGNSTGVTGSFQYISPEGDQIVVIYIADENGFRPSGEHLPTPPTIPEYILKSIEYNKAHSQEEKLEKETSDKPIE